VFAAWLDSAAHTAMTWGSREDRSTRRWLSPTVRMPRLLSNAFRHKSPRSVSL
jgi:hypothetical protein